MDRNGTKRKHSVFAYLHIFLRSHASLRLLFGFPLKVLLEIFRDTRVMLLLERKILMRIFFFYRPDITEKYSLFFLSP